MRKQFFLISVILTIPFFGISQTTFPNNGAPQTVHTIYAFTNCSLHVDAELVIANATLIIQDGIILNAGAKLVVPKEAISLDLKGKHIYPAFIDLYKIGRAHV